MSDREYALGERNPKTLGTQHEERERTQKWRSVLAWALRPGGKY